MFCPKYNKTYTIPNASTNLTVVKISYIGDTYCKVKLQMHTKQGTLIETFNAKLFYNKIQHWELVK